VLDVPLWLWLAFGAIVVVALAVDLLAHRKAHVIGFREAAWWSALWVGLAVAFGVVVFAVLGVRSNPYARP
jgi:tellurite resistance protein TerC